MSSEGELRNDCTALIQFIQRITLLCERRRSREAFDSASRALTDYVAALGDATLAYLDHLAESAPKSDPILFYVYRQKLWNLRENWTALHSFVKPTKDADTLNSPTSLIAALTNRVRALIGLSGARFAVFHTHDVNYLHLNTDQ